MTSAPSRKRATILLATGGYANTGISILHGLLLIPLYLYYLGANLYGFWLASGGMLGMLALANFGVSSMLIQRVAQAYGKNNNQQAAAYFINGTVVYLGICALYLFLGGTASFFLPAILHVQGEQAVLLQDCFRLALVGMALGIFNECLRGFAQALLRPVFTLVSLVSCRLAGIAVTVVLLIYGLGLWAIPIGTLAAEAAIFVLSGFDTIRLLRMLQARISLQWDLIREYMRTSPALFMARLGSTLAQESEPLLITIFISPEITTVYMVTRKAADMVFQGLSVLNGASYSSFAHLAGQESRKKLDNTARVLLSVVFSLGLVGFATYVCVNYVFVSLWVGESFALDQGAILVIGIGFFMRAFRGMLWQLLYGLSDFSYTSWVMLSEGLLRIGLIVLLMDMLGIIGVPLALLLSCLGSLAILGIRLRKQLFTTLETGSMFRYLLSAIVLFAISMLVAQYAPDSVSWGMFIFVLTIWVILASLIFLSINPNIYQRVTGEIRAWNS